MTLRERETEEAARAARMATAAQVVARRRGLGTAALNPELLYSTNPAGWKEALYLGEWWEAVARLRATAHRFHFGPYGTDSPTSFGAGEKIVMHARVAQTRRILARLREARAAQD